jgi:hypothetical protein
MEPCLALLLLLVRLAFLLFAVTFCKQHKRERFSRSTTGHELFAGSDRCRAGPHTHTHAFEHTRTHKPVLKPSPVLFAWLKTCSRCSRHLTSPHLVQEPLRSSRGCLQRNGVARPVVGSRGRGLQWPARPRLGTAGKGRNHDQVPVVGYHPHCQQSRAD